VMWVRRFISYACHSERSEAKPRTARNR